MGKQVMLQCKPAHWLLVLISLIATAQAWPLPSTPVCPSNCSRDARASQPCVCTSSGRLVGFRESVEFPGMRAFADEEVDTLGSKALVRQVDIWLGIPYAQPPIGRLRFSRPEELHQPGQWLPCQTARPACYQDLDPNYVDTAGSRMWVVDSIGEDCLHLNVWVPRPGDDETEAGGKRRAPLTTMVWFYGGSFTAGGANLEIYDGRYLAASQNVIVVSMNYRNGPFGFLYLNTSMAPGNMGLWDQWLALKWVAANIAAFGGHPSRVSLFGESSGAVSVSLHTVSPWSQMLFQHAIMQSGGLHCHWGVMRPEEAFRKSVQLAQKVNCTGGQRGHSLAAVVDCLSSRSPSAIMRAFGEMFQQKNYFEFVFSPVFDRDFLPFKDFTQLLERTGQHVKPGSQMFGYNKNEGTYFLLYAFLSDSQWRATPEMNERKLRIPNEATFDQYLHRILNPFHLQNQPLYDLLFQRAKFQYTEDDEIYEKSGSEAYVAALDRMSGDLSFKCPVMYSAKSVLTNHSRIFFYEFDYRNERLPWPQWMGVMHGYEIDFVFGAPFNRAFQAKFYAYSRREQELSWYMMKYWANFAKTGDPNLGDHAKPFAPTDDGLFINWQPANGTRQFGDMPHKYLSQTMRTLRVNASAQFEWSVIGVRQLRDCGFWKWHVERLYSMMMNQRPPPHCSTE